MRKPSIQAWAIERIATTVDGSAKILEIGCGTGETSTLLKERAFAVRCADVDCWHPERIDLDHTSGADLSARLPFGSAECDAVVCLEVLEHVTNPFNAVGELSRILRGGGYLFLTLPNFWSARSRWRFLWRGAVSRSRVRDEVARRNLVSGACPPHINTMPWTTLKYALVSYGLQVVEICGYQRRVASHLEFLPLATAIWLFTRTLPQSQCDRFELGESNRWSILFGSSHVYICAKKARTGCESEA